MQYIIVCVRVCVCIFHPDTFNQKRNIKAHILGIFKGRSNLVDILFSTTFKFSILDKVERT